MMESMSTAPAPYLSGLHLAGRRVVVLGAGRVAERRLVRLLEAGAEVTVVAPTATAVVRDHAAAGRIHWLSRGYRTGDLAGAWYVVVATDDPGANDRASVEAEERQVFCVRSDRADAATAWTPAVGEVDGVQFGVLGGGDPRLSKQVRDLLVRTLAGVRPLRLPRRAGKQAA